MRSPHATGPQILKQKYARNTLDASETPNTSDRSMTWIEKGSLGEAGGPAPPPAARTARERREEAFDRRRRLGGAEAQESGEPRPRVEAPVHAEDELVDVGVERIRRTPTERRSSARRAGSVSEQPVSGWGLNLLV